MPHCNAVHSLTMIWLEVLSRDTKGIIIWDWGLAPSNLEVIEDRKCWKANSMHIHNPGKYCKLLLWTTEETQYWAGTNCHSSTALRWRKHRTEIFLFSGIHLCGELFFFNLEGEYLLSLDSLAVSSAAVRKEEKVQGSWDLKCDQKKSRTDVALKRTPLCTWGWPFASAWVK